MPRPPFRYRLADWFAERVNQAGNLWNRLVWPIEAFFGRLGEGLFGAFDSFADAERLVVRLVKGLLWPITALARLIGSWLPVGSSAGRSGSLPGRMFHRAGVGVFSLAERLNLDGLLVLVIQLLKPLWWPLGALLGLANAWIATRQSRELALAVPALLLAAPFGYVVVQASWQGESAIVERYKIAVRDAVEAGNYEQSELYERKLAQLGVDTRRNDYRTALRLAEEGDFDAAYHQMSKLASAEQPGYASAHFWIVQQLLAGESGQDAAALPDSKDDRYKLAEQHLDRLGELGIEGVGVARMRAFLQVQTNRTEEAIATLEPYAADQIDAAAMLLRLHVGQRNQQAARLQASRVMELIRREQRRDALDIGLYEPWLLAAQLLGDTRQIELAIDGWLEAAPDAERPRAVRAAFLSDQAEQLIADSTANPARIAELLNQAVSAGASDSWLSAQLARLSRGASMRAERTWESLVDLPDTPESLLFTVATHAASTGAIEPARRGYAKLIAAETKNPDAWNNYAWTLLQEPAPDPEVALEAINRALELRPGDHRFRETRGQVRIALEQWDEAAADLEYALNGLPEAADAHRSLAKAYAAMGKTKLADLHRRQASR